MNCTKCNELIFGYIEGLMHEQEKKDLEAHIEACATCQQALKDMQTLQTSLTQHGQEVAQIRLETPVLGAIVRGQKKQLKSVTPPLRRSIMKNPIIRLAIAAIVVIACALGFILMSSTQNIALADVLTRIEQVRAYLYQMNMTITNSGDLPAGYPATQDVKAEILIAPEYGMKMTMGYDSEKEGGMVQEQYIQPQHKRILMIMPEQKKYMEMELTDQMLEQHKKQSNDPRIMIEQFMNCDYEKIEKSHINGIEVQGFHTTDPAYAGGALGDTDVTLWVDTETWLPVQVDMDIAIKGERTMHMKGVMTDFEWDVPVDASVFEPIIPDDYTAMLGGGSIKLPEMTEETTVKGFKLFSEYTNEYPKDLSMMAVMNSARKIMDSNTPAVQGLKQVEEDGNPDEISKTIVDFILPMQAPAGFHALLVQEKKEPAYYGHIVTPDQPDLILMRWKMEDGQYRVIFGDLTVETVTPLRLAELEDALPEEDSQ